MKMRSQTAGRLVAMTFAMFCFGFLHADVASAATYYVATNGNDANPGTQSQPFQTVQKGISVLQAGDTLYLRGGTYAATIDVNRQTIPAGTSWSSPVTIASYPNETAILSPTSGSVILNLAYSTVRYIIFDRLVVDGSRLTGGAYDGTSHNWGVSILYGAHHIRFQNGQIRNVNGVNVALYGDSNDASYAAYTRDHQHTDIWRRIARTLHFKCE